MAEIKEFIINDRRKFTADGDIRPDAPPSEPKPPRPETIAQPATADSAKLVEQRGPQAVPNAPKPQAETPEAITSTGDAAHAEMTDAGDQLPPPTPDQIEQAKRAYDATVDRLDTAIRATNPGKEHIPQLTFERLIQSLYMQAMMQLGGASAPGQQPQVDIIGARQTIDMLGIFAAKTKGNLSPTESTLLDTALFELHMGFLEITQALARQSAGRQPGPQPSRPGGLNPVGGPSIVR